MYGITSASIKFGPLIDQTGFYRYNTPQVISDYLRLFCRYVYKSQTPNISLSISQIYPH